MGVSIMLMGIFYFVAVCTMGSGQHVVFSFRGSSGNSSGRKLNLTAGIPIRIPGECPPHMDRYPDPSNKTSWICDCVRGYLYFPLKESCYQPYRRGPCKPSEYLTLPKGQILSKCEGNPCKEDGLVPFRNGCHPLLVKEGPCEDDDILGVNETTFHLECMPVDLSPFHVIDPGEGDGCPAGSRRTAQGICRVPL
ncbi:uncharacterized protein LOC107043355 [Diachasma alloeum]|uniref:uncharacterized protein LOC107043355 n=1 Tax=Diachasma alloeum TaxID=454923 RepID=UPI000738294C|nr:uncharacterized protein LOC107043355 [Diachasma alloeum]